MEVGVRGAPTPTPRVFYVEETRCASSEKASVSLFLALVWRAAFLVMGTVCEVVTLDFLPRLGTLDPSTPLARRPRWTLGLHPPREPPRPTPSRCPREFAVAFAGSNLLVWTSPRPLPLLSSLPAPMAHRAVAGHWTWPIRCMTRVGAHRDSPLLRGSVVLPFIAMGTCSPWGPPSRATTMLAWPRASAQG